MASRGQELRWVLRAQSGDADALNALLESIQEPLYGYILSLVRDPHRAQDTLQDVLVLVIRKLYWLREPRVFRPWVFRIASRESFRCLRREHRIAVRTEDESSLQSIAAELPEDRADPELLQRLPALLEQVPPASRAVLGLHYLNEMTLREVADVLEISLGAAKARLGYGLAILRRKMSLAPLPRRVGPAGAGADGLESVAP
jgi:RNA polymerase sigma-70 factor (ECF subfamily)